MLVEKVFAAAMRNLKSIRHNLMQKLNLVCVRFDFRRTMEILLSMGKESIYCDQLCLRSSALTMNKLFFIVVYFMKSRS